MTLRKSLLLFVGLGMISAFVACSSSSSKPAPTIAISATSGTPQSVQVGNAFATLQATVTSNGNPSSGATVTFTAPSSGASCLFANNTATDTETTNSSGVAISSVCTANTTAGAYNVTASTSGASTSAVFSLTNTAGAAANLAATSGNNQSVAVSGTYAPLVAQVTDSDGNGVSGVSITFTVTAGAGGASGTFTSTSSGTESVSTDANGNAAVSDLVANSTLGGFTVAAAPTTATLTPASVTFSETNVAPGTPPVAAGNYVFSVSGTNGNGPYYWVGVFTVTTSGSTSTITGGEQDYSDFGEPAFISAEPITGGSITTVGGGDPDLLITLNFSDAYINNGSGSLTLDASMISATKGQLMEYDSWGSGTGELDLQTGTAAPSAGYAFYASGWDSSFYPLTIGGVINIDSATGISGAGSIFDLNDGGSLSPDELFSTSSFSGPDPTTGLVTFTFNSSTFGQMMFDGYIVDANHIRLVENWQDSYGGTTAGTARGQGGNTGNFGSTSISGATYVVGTVGNDSTNGALDVGGMLTFNFNGSVSGNLSFNDLVATNPAQGGAAITGGTYTIDGGPTCTANDCGTGRVTLTGVTDGTTFTYDLQLYLDGSGHATVISMDANDVVAGVGSQQASATFTADTFTGPYVVYFSGFNTSELYTNNGGGTYFGETDLLGVLTSTPSSSTAGAVAGFFDQNEVQVGGGLATNNPASASYATTSTNGVFDISPTSGLYTYYMVDTTGSGAIIENDNSGLALGSAQQQ